MKKLILSLELCCAATNFFAQNADPVSYTHLTQAITNLITVHLSYIVTDVTSFPIPVFVHIWQRIMRRLWSYADGFVMVCGFA